MTLSPTQIHLFTSLINYYLKHRGNFIEEITRLQTKMIYTYNQAGREAKTEDGKNNLCAKADKEEIWLEERLGQWQYENFYLRKLLQALRAIERSKNAIAA